MIRPLLSALLFAALTLAVAFGDLSGKWAGTSEFVNRAGEARTDSVYMVLKQGGGEVSGTVGPDADRQRPLENARLEGSKLTFEVAEGGDRKVRVELTIEGDQMTGQASFVREYGTITAKLSLKRE